MSTIAAAIENPSIVTSNSHQLRQCAECGAPMLLMSATLLKAWPGVIRKTYECIVCKSVDLQTMSINSD